MHKLIALGLLVSSVLLGFGCARSEATPVRGPDGREWVAITCRDKAENCWRAAGDLCGAGYEMASEVQSKTGGFLFFGHHTRDEMLVRCKAPGEVAVVLPVPPGQ